MRTCVCYHCIDDRMTFINLMITYGFLFVKTLSKNKSNKTKSNERRGKMPNFELTAKDAYRYFNMLPEKELDEFLRLMEADEENESQENETSN